MLHLHEDPLLKGLKCKKIPAPNWIPPHILNVMRHALYHYATTTTHSRARYYLFNVSWQKGCFKDNI